jgi:hypothetical protein
VKKKPVSAGPVLRYNAGSGYSLKPLPLGGSERRSKILEQHDGSGVTDGVFSLDGNEYGNIQNSTYLFTSTYS